MAIRLLSVDVDGTITNGRNEITPATLAALRGAIDAGILVALNTGRDLSESRLVLDRVPEIPYLLGCTGAYLMDLRTGERLISHPVPIALARQAYQILARYDTLVSLYMDDVVYNQAAKMAEFTRFYPPELVSVFSSHHGVPDLGALLDARMRDIDKYYVVFVDPDEQKRAFAEMAELPLFVTRAAMLDMEVMAQGANKGAILLDLASRLGLRPEEIAAIGDSENDLPMLQAAGLGIAMGNAKPHIQAAADVVAPTNEQDGLAWAVDQILKGAL